MHDIFQGSNTRDLRNLALFIDIIVEHSLMLKYSREILLQTWGFQQGGRQLNLTFVTYVKSSRPLHQNFCNR